MKLHWLLLLFCFPNLVWANALSDFLAELRTLQATFEQKLYSETGELLETSQGKMFIQRPGKFHWNYDKPFDQLIVADSKKVWIYDRELEQVTAKELNKALGKTPALLLSSEENVEDNYFVTELFQESDVVDFELVPKDPQAQFKKIRIGLRDGNLYKIALSDNLDQITVISFTQVKRNQPLAAELFIFVPPKDADIIREE